MYRAEDRREGAFSGLFGDGSVPEKQGHAPEPGEPHQRENDAADCGGLPSEDRCDDVEPENTDAAPVESADDGQSQANAVHYHG